MISSVTNPYKIKIHEFSDIILDDSAYSSDEYWDFINFKGDVIVDLGCGACNFLRQYAERSPNTRFVGFELRFKRLHKGAGKFKKRDLKNIRLVRDKAENIEKWFHAGTVTQVNINFPDPWAKRRQLKHRLITIDYLKTLHRLLNKNGNCCFKTDHPSYFMSVVELIRGMSEFEIIEYSEDLQNSVYNEANIPTEFEQLFNNKGIPTYYLKLKPKQIV